MLVWRSFVPLRGAHKLLAELARVVWDLFEGGKKNRGNTVYPQDEQYLHSTSDKPQILLPHTQEQWTRTTSFCSEWASTETEKPAEHLSVQGWPVKSVMFWMWRMVSMIARELNSVTRIHNECIRFHSLMVKQQLHIIIQKFVFHSKSNYVTYNKSCLGSLL